MKISVVTISYNQAKFLRQCIDSVLDQDYQNIEYIIVDPGSTDGSRRIIDSYGDKIIKVFDKDCGPADGLNIGFSKASGDIFYFINSDDYVLPGAFSFVTTEFSKEPSIDILLGGGIEVNGQGVWKKNYYPSSASPEAYVNGAVTLFQQGMFFKAQAFRQTAGFNTLNRTSWDGELLLCFLIEKLHFKRTMLLLAAFRVYPESITGSQRLSMEYEADKDRMFKLVYGPDSSSNYLVKLWFRFRKLAFDPRYAFMRIMG